MSNTATISFTVDTTDATIPLGVEAWLDDQLQVDIAHVKESTPVEFEFADSDAEHTLKFVVKGKQQSHTKLDIRGNVIKDAVIRITQIKFDGIELSRPVLDKFEYKHDFNGTGPETTAKFYPDCGCNGEITAQFTTPIYLWLLENL